MNFLIASGLGSTEYLTIGFVLMRSKEGCNNSKPIDFSIVSGNFAGCAVASIIQGPSFVSEKPQAV